MKLFSQILEEDEAVEYLKSHNLTKQYQNSKSKILQWNFQKLDLKKREPKNAWVWSFRINKKYRALWYEREGRLIIVEIDDHQ